MRELIPVVGRVFLMLAVFGGLVVPSGLAAQGSRSLDRVIFFSPFPGEPGDTAFAGRIGEALRDRAENRMRSRFRIITTDEICQTLQGSGFDCVPVLAQEHAVQLVRAMQAGGYSFSWLHRDGDSLRLQIRIVDEGRTGLSGWVTSTSPSGATPQEIARTAIDHIEEQLRVADFARECVQRRGRGDLRGARDRADRALQINPTHPSAAMCVALIFEATRAPADSLIWALELATRGDTMNTSAWSMLARRYQDRGAPGDTARAVNAFMQQLRADPADMRLRVALVALNLALGENATALELLEPALAASPTEMSLLRYQERACLELGHWDCALESMESQYQLDESLAGDSAFYFKAFGAAQEGGATVRALRWARRAVHAFPNSVRALQAQAMALTIAAQRDSAVTVYRRILQLDSTQVGAAFSAAQLSWDTAGLVIDSTVPINREQILRGDTLYQTVLRLTGTPATAGDSAMWTNVALQYYQVSVRLVNQRMELPMASRFLRQAREYDVGRRLEAPVHFFLGLSNFFQIFALDARVREAQTCAMVREFSAVVTEARQALEIGRSVSPQTADQLLETVRRVEGQLPAYREAFCR